MAQHPRPLRAVRRALCRPGAGRGQVEAVRGRCRVPGNCRRKSFGCFGLNLRSHRTENWLMTWCSRRTRSAAVSAGGERLPSRSASQRRRPACSRRDRSKSCSRTPSSDHVKFRPSVAGDPGRGRVAGPVALDQGSAVAGGGGGWTAPSRRPTPGTAAARHASRGARRTAVAFGDARVGRRDRRRANPAGVYLS